jgi:hypothetical protein
LLIETAPLVSRGQTGMAIQDLRIGHHRHEWHDRGNSAHLHQSNNQHYRQQNGGLAALRRRQKFVDLSKCCSHDGISAFPAPAPPGARASQPEPLPKSAAGSGVRPRG